MQNPVRTNCYIFLFDGARDDVFRELLSSGLLPNVKEHIVDRGSLLSAVTTFPSTTGPAHIPFVTGQFAGTSDVLGYRWFDRTLLSRGYFRPSLHRSYSSFNTFRLPQDMNQDCVTLFELFARPGQVMGLVNLCRGTSLRKLFWTFLLGMGVGHFTGRWALADTISERAMLSYVKHGCDFVYTTFYGIDEVAHLCSPFDDRVIRHYRRVDRTVGRVVELLRRQGRLDDSLLVVVSDHGHSPTETHVAVVDRIKAHGFKPLYYPFTFLPPYDSAVMESGNGMCMLYFFGNPRERRRSDEQLASDPATSAVLREFENHPGISFVATRAANGDVILRGAAGTARFRRIGNDFEIESEGEPLWGGPGAPGLNHRPSRAAAITTGRYGDEDLFHRSLQTPYPDLFAQYWALFSSRRCGDVVLSAQPGYDLRLQHEHPVHHSSHGSIRWEHMVTPFAVNVPLARSAPIRTADVFPLICRLCGKKIPPAVKIDGTLHPEMGGARES